MNSATSAGADGLTAAEARSLLGTLSAVPADIESAFRHRYQQLLTDLSHAGDEDARLALEHRLLRLSRAFRLLLGLPPAIPEQPARSSAAPEQPAPCQTEATSAALAPVPAALPNRWLLLPVLLLICLMAASTGAFFMHLKQQIGTLEHVLTLQTDQLVHLQEMHMGERRQWLAQLSLQQHQLADQQAQLSHQAQAASQLQQQLAQADKSLALSLAHNDALQLQIDRLQQVSDQLIASLCQDSARVSPAIGLALQDDYMRRCQQSWQMAAH